MDTAQGTTGRLACLLNCSDVPLETRELLPRQTLVLSTSARVDLAYDHANGANPQKVPQLELVRFGGAIPVSALSIAENEVMCERWKGVFFSVVCKAIGNVMIALYANCSFDKEKVCDMCRGWNPFRDDISYL